ncbi:unnamed protein product [Notodromas monacha]|uniref:EGF-like domain-containing protein n=1 Tax=Notodromas monacha TaxID=399045 RepID=A0A7R9GKD9_9CRUS|nr:unnamed protein product [Notodromas monacha]CAG0924521.1 unnamed protein product [Notodromas monacha]
MAASVLPTRDFRASADSQNRHMFSNGKNNDGVIRSCLCPPGFGGTRCQDQGKMVVIDVDCGETEIVAEDGIIIEFAALGVLPGYPPPDTCPSRFTDRKPGGVHQLQDEPGKGFSKTGFGPSRGLLGNFNDTDGRNFSGSCYSESTLALLRFVPGKNKV